MWQRAGDSGGTGEWRSGSNFGKKRCHGHGHGCVPRVALVPPSFVKSATEGRRLSDTYYQAAPTGLHMRAMAIAEWNQALVKKSVEIANIHGPVI